LRRRGSSSWSASSGFFPLHRCLTHVIDELFEEALDAYETAVVSVAAQPPSLECLSLAKAVESGFKERWVELTRYTTTSVDERFVRSLLKLGAVLKVLYAHVRSNLPTAAVEEEAALSLLDFLNATYAQAYAALKFVLFHTTPEFVALPRPFILSELTVIMGGITELYYLAKALAETVAATVVRT